MAGIKLTSEEMAGLDLLIRAKQLEASGGGGEEGEEAFIGAIAKAVGRVTGVVAKVTPVALQVARAVGGRETTGGGGGGGEGVPQNVSLEQLLELRRRATVE